MVVYCIAGFGFKNFKKPAQLQKVSGYQKADLDNLYLSSGKAIGGQRDLSFSQISELAYDLMSICDSVFVISEPSYTANVEYRMALKMELKIKYETPTIEKLWIAWEERNGYRIG